MKIDFGASSWRQIYVAVGLTSLATLLLELSITRLFSVILYYHFAFMAISIALFGLGIGGVFSYVAARWRGGTFAKLGTFAALNSVVVVLVLLAIVSIKGRLGVATLAQIYFYSALPFLFAGVVLSMAISETIERVERVYFIDLLGAGAGCLLLVPLLDWLGGPNTILVAGLLFACSSVFWFNLSGWRWGKWVGAALAAGLVILIAYNRGHSVIDVTYAKGAILHDESFVKWNSFSRIALMKKPEGYSIEIDADANTSIPSYDFDNLSLSDRSKLLYDVSGIPYVLRPRAKTLIIGPGGGIDVSRALAGGSTDVTGVEINPITATTIMRERFPALSKNLYLRPEVRIIVEDGRSYVRRSPERYQVLQATLVDTWASTAAGAFALTENNLYTTDAFRDYLTHLTDDGLVAITRWGFDPPRESLRLLTLGREALLELGERDYARYMIVFREKTSGAWGSHDTVMISRKPFTAPDLATVKAAVSEAKLELLYSPDEQIPNPFTELMHGANPAQFEKDYAYLVSAVDDDQPFFFYTVQPRDLMGFIRAYLTARVSRSAEADYKINIAIPLLFGLVVVSLVATGLILLLPPLLLGTQLPREQNTRRFLWYFLAIGIGYILIEVALIQKCVLFLGHPTYALTVIVFSMLVSSGLGSFYSRRALGDGDGRLTVQLLIVALLIGLLSLALGPVLGAGVGLPFWVKTLITVGLISPAGFAMGMPFPTALRRLERQSGPSLRWAWSLNAAASVLGSVAAIVIAIYFGLRATLLTGGLMYLVACAVLRLAPVRETVSSKQAVG